MAHYYFTEKTKTALQNLLDWFTSLEIGSPDLTWEVAGEKATTRHIIDYIKYIGKHTPKYRSGWELTFMTFCDTNKNILY